MAQKIKRSLNENKTVSVILHLLRDEQGQTTTEYVLLLAVLAGTIITLGTAFRKKISELFQGRVGNYVESRFFNPGSMHRFPLQMNR